jgi:hypothetical protein
MTQTSVIIGLETVCLLHAIHQAGSLVSLKRVCQLTLYKGKKIAKFLEFLKP